MISACVHSSRGYAQIDPGPEPTRTQDFMRCLDRDKCSMTSPLMRRLLFSISLIIPAVGLIPTMVEAWVAPPSIGQIALEIIGWGKEHS